MLLLCPIVLFYGRNKYTRTPPTGSVLGQAIRAWRFAARGRWSWNPVKCYKQMNAPGFWDAAKPSKLAPGGRPAWMTFDDAWVNELRRGLTACKVFVWFPVYCECSKFLLNLIGNALHAVPLRVNVQPDQQQLDVPSCNDDYPRCPK